MTHSQIVGSLETLMTDIGGGNSRLPWFVLSRVLEALAAITETYPYDPSFVLVSRAIVDVLDRVESSGTFVVIDYLDPRPDPIPCDGAIEYAITGTVQGVGFRAYVQSEANRSNLHGWIRNEPDGIVRAVLYPLSAFEVPRFESIVLNAPNAVIASLGATVL